LASKTQGRVVHLRRSTIVAAAVLTAWFALDFVGVPKLVDREPLVSPAGVMLALMAAFIAAGLLRLPFVAPIYVAALAVWAALQIQTHWSTYISAASEAKLHWYARAFGDHWRVLPDLADRTVPDAYHTVLAVLLSANLAIALADTLRPGAKPVSAGKKPAA
jgi:hypothetical protein